MSEASVVCLFESGEKRVNKRLRHLNVFNCSVYGHCLNMTS